MGSVRRTYLAAVGIETNAFKRGMREIQKQVNSLKSTFMGVAGALGAGIGFAGFLRNLKDTTIELSVAEATLKNVSKSATEFAETQMYLSNMAKNYKQDLIGLTNNFAQFHAAAEGTNITLEQQKKIYESLTRAGAYFHMTASRTNDMMLAVTQMMSKGKITAEELRRQLGNSLPGAFNKMAQAAQNLGLTKTIAEFEDLMRKGKITSDVLVEFANVLNQTTQNIDLNSVQLQLNELKNTWTSFVKSANFETMYSKMLKMVNDLTKYVTKNIGFIGKEITYLAIIVIAGKLLKAIGSVLNNLYKIWKGNWITLIATGIATIISYVSDWHSELTKVEKKLKDIAGIQDKEIKIVQLQNLLDETNSSINDFESNPKLMNRYKRYKENEANYNKYQKYQSPIYDPATASYQTPIKPIKSKRIDIYEQNLKDRERIMSELNNLGALMGPFTGTTTNNTTVGGNVTQGGEESDIVKAVNKYKEGLKELNNQYENGVYTDEEFAKELKKLQDEAYKNISAFGKFDEILKQLPNTLQQVINGLPEQFKTNRKEDAAAEQAKIDKENADKWAKYKAPEQKTRDDRFDYKKSNADIAEEIVDNAKDWQETLERTLENLMEGKYGNSQAVADEISRITEELRNATANATTFDEAYQLSQFVEDLENARKSVIVNFSEGMRGVARALERITNSSRSLMETFNNPDANAWQKVLTVMTTLASTMELISTIAAGLNTIKALGIILQKTENREVLKEQALKAGLITEEGFLNAEKIAGAIASIFSGQGAIPFIGIGLALAGVAAMIGGIASAKNKYATGGIVGGNNYRGDKVMASVNSGEMILNAGQQRNLFDAINSGNFGGGNVNFVIKGKDLVGVIDNYQQIIKG